MRSCPGCGRVNPDNAFYCNGCGGRMANREEPVCPACGHTNPRDAKYCGACRAVMPSWAAPPREMPPPLPVIQAGPPPDSKVAHIWETTPARFNPAPDGRPVGITIAGLLLLAAGAVAISMGVYDLAIAGSIDPMVADGFGTIDISRYATCCGTLLVLFGAGAFAGGYFTLVQERWTFALLGAILATISVGPYCVCFLLGLIAIILIAAGKDQFAN